MLENLKLQNYFERWRINAYSAGFKRSFLCCVVIVQPIAEQDTQDGNSPGSHQTSGNLQIWPLHGVRDNWADIFY